MKKRYRGSQPVGPKFSLGIAGLVLASSAATCFYLAVLFGLVPLTPTRVVIGVLILVFLPPLTIILWRRWNSAYDYRREQRAADVHEARRQRDARQRLLEKTSQDPEDLAQRMAEQDTWRDLGAISGPWRLPFFSRHHREP